MLSPEEEVRYLAAARWRIPLSQHAAAILDLRRARAAGSEWVFPARTRTGHIEPASVKRAPHIDPSVYGHLSSHRDMAITRRCVHPQSETIREAIETAQAATGGHAFRHTYKGGDLRPTVQTAVIN